MSDYENMTVAELKQLLKEAGLPVSGKKADLISRLEESSEEPVVEEAAEEDGIDISTRISAGLIPSETPGTPEEVALMAKIDVELANVDASAEVRDGTENGVPPPADPAHRDALDDLERELSDLDF